ncbi:unnamed protein product [Oppiella nova]|uniref:Nuclear receptor domain-containing protein n=1 Tax=Oppiella nova TaxID=334625 RepID=A0A7R9MN88_9ACAR|nr:unnamed protein product [Oppiella nova]CAG2180120.1 unnamed protein product [Oppiella nova]
MAIQDQLKCYLGGNCVIDVDSRTNCKKCRLDKCLAVEVMILRMVLDFNFDGNYWTVISNNKSYLVKLDLLKDPPINSDDDDSPYKVYSVIKIFTFIYFNAICK